MSYGSADSSDDYVILVLGKTGNGKSSLCNAILGENRFPVGRGMASTTRTAQCEAAVKGNVRIKVVDTPDVTNCDMDAQRRREEVSKWRQLTLPHPTAVLVAVRCDIRYTPEEHTVYKETMALWGDKALKERLLVAFTFGDRQDTPLEEELKTVCPELQSVLRDAGHQYILFDKKDAQSTSGLPFQIMEAVDRRCTRSSGRSRQNKVSPADPPPGPGRSRLPGVLAVIILLFLLVAAAGGCVVALVLGYTAPALGCGVAGVALAVVLLVLLVYGQHRDRWLL